MMRSFDRLSAIAAPLPIANIDTDMILPAAFLRTVSRRGLGSALFHSRRYEADGAASPDFILNRAPWRGAGILVTLGNLGCGSSREHAPWALLDFGIRCLIAPSFAEIFQRNCVKNGMLPIALADYLIDTLLSDAADPATAFITVDLEDRTIRRTDGAVIHFGIDDGVRRRLMAGQDDIARSMEFATEIVRHEQTARQTAPWICGISVEV